MNKKEYDRQRYLKKREEILARNKAYNLKNSDALKVYSKQWYLINKETHSFKRRQRYKRSKEKELLIAKEYRKNNRSKLTAYVAKRRAIKLNQTPKWADLKAIEQFYNNCPKGYHVDHIIPLQGKNVRGLHTLENLQYLPAIENMSKGNRF